MIAYIRTQISRVFLFWLGFILTRPLGATVGEFLNKPHNQGGLALGRLMASLTLAVVIVACLVVIFQIAARDRQAA